MILAVSVYSILPVLSLYLQKDTLLSTNDQIAEKLKGDGLSLERRTVALYRKKLGFEIASKRVKF